MQVISYILDILFSVIFSLSFHSKIINLVNFRYEILSYKVLFDPFLLKISACFILFLEAFIVLCFATGIMLEIGIAIAILLLVSFTILYLRKKKLTGKKECHCFGQHNWLNQVPHYRNIFLIVLLILRLLLPHRLVVGDILIVIVVVIFYCGLQVKSYFSESKSLRSVVLEKIRMETGRLYNYIIVLGNQGDVSVDLDRILSNASFNKESHVDIAVVLNAPDWFIAMKVNKWKGVLLLAQEDILPQSINYSFILVCNSCPKRKVYSIVTEIDGFVEWWGRQNVKSS